MGRRAKKQAKPTKKRAVVAKTFKCPFCNMVDSVECKMDNRARVGRVACRVCGAAFSMGINYLMEPIDVFCEWLDQCEAANAREMDGISGGGGATSGTSEIAPQLGTAEAAIQDDDDDSDDGEFDRRVAAPLATVPAAGSDSERGGGGADGGSGGNEGGGATADTGAGNEAAVPTAGDKRKFDSADLGLSSDSDSD